MDETEARLKRIEEKLNIVADQVHSIIVVMSAMHTNLQRPQFPEPPEPPMPKHLTNF